MNDLKNRFEDTFQFLAGYFTEDFGDEFGEPELAVKKYVMDSNSVLRASVVGQLRRLLAECDESRLDAAIFELGCYYSPERHRGVTIRSWVEQVIAQLEQSLNAVNDK